LLLGAYQALCRQIGLGKVKMYPRMEMLDLVLIEGEAKGIVVRDLITGKSPPMRRRIVLATGGYAMLYLSTNGEAAT
jgi:succinate dehydrogenase / fumarate reductase flavoprotein subunit